MFASDDQREQFRSFGQVVYKLGDATTRSYCKALTRGARILGDTPTEEQLADYALSLSLSMHGQFVRGWDLWREYRSLKGISLPKVPRPGSFWINDKIWRYPINQAIYWLVLCREIPSGMLAKAQWSSIVRLSSTLNAIAFPRGHLPLISEDTPPLQAIYGWIKEPKVHSPLIPRMPGGDIPMASCALAHRAKLVHDGMQTHCNVYVKTSVQGKMYYKPPPLFPKYPSNYPQEAIDRLELSKPEQNMDYLSIPVFDGQTIALAPPIAAKTEEVCGSDQVKSAEQLAADYTAWRRQFEKELLASRKIREQGAATTSDPQPKPLEIPALDQGTDQLLKLE